MAANIDAEIRQIQQASRGEQVRDAIVSALIAINDSDGSATRELVNEIVDAAIKALDVSEVGGNGKYIKSISETDGKISASEETMDTQPVRNSVKAITSGGVFSLKETLQQNFQAGVDSIYDAVVAKGSTPASKSLSDVIQGIEDIPTGGETPVIEHTNNWVKNANIGPMYFTSADYIWTDGVDLYYSDPYSDSVFDPDTLKFEPIQISIEYETTKVNGNNIINVGGNTYLMDGSTYVFDRSSLTFKRVSTPNISTSGYFPCIWSDGDDIYYSYGTNQYVLDQITGIWSEKTWNGLTSFAGNDVWTDGTNIYYSNGTKHYVLDKSTSTWNTKIWSGFTSFNGNDIWTDGTDIYYSYQTTHYVLNKELSVWYTKTWNGLTTFNGYYIWSYNNTIYYSNGSAQYVLDTATYTWSAKTWTGLTSFIAPDIWFENGNIYHSNYGNHYQLDINTSTWTQKIFTNSNNSIYGRFIWSYGGVTYCSYNDYQFVVDTQNLTFVLQTLNISRSYIWTDGTDIYYSYSGTHYILDQSILGWRTKTWTGLTSFQGNYVWSDGIDVYYSYSGTQKVLDKATSTWNNKSWSGLTSFDGRSVKNLNGRIYYAWDINRAYLLDVQGSAWNVVYNWNPINLMYVFGFNNVFYGFINNISHYIYNSNDDSWSETLITGPTSLDPANIWSDGGNIYYSSGTSQFVLDKTAHVWRKKTWSGITSFSGQYIWTDGETCYYSTDSTQYVLNKELSLWYATSWTGITSFSRAKIWDDGESIYYTNGLTSYELEKPTT